MKPARCPECSPLPPQSLPLHDSGVFRGISAFSIGLTEWNHTIAAENIQLKKEVAYLQQKLDHSVDSAPSTPLKLLASFVGEQATGTADSELDLQMRALDSGSSAPDTSEMACALTVANLLKLFPNDEGVLSQVRKLDESRGEGLAQRVHLLTALQWLLRGNLHKASLEGGKLALVESLMMSEATVVSLLKGKGVDESMQEMFNEHMYQRTLILRKPLTVQSMSAALELLSNLENLKKKLLVKGYINSTVTDSEFACAKQGALIEKGFRTLKVLATDTSSIAYDYKPTLEGGLGVLEEQMELLSATATSAVSELAQIHSGCIEEVTQLILTHEEHRKRLCELTGHLDYGGGSLKQPTSLSDGLRTLRNYNEIEDSLLDCVLVDPSNEKLAALQKSLKDSKKAKIFLEKDHEATAKELTSLKNELILKHSELQRARRALNFYQEINSALHTQLRQPAQQGAQNSELQESLERAQAELDNKGTWLDYLLKQREDSENQLKEVKKRLKHEETENVQHKAAFLPLQQAKSQFYLLSTELANVGFTSKALRSLAKLIEKLVPGGLVQCLNPVYEAPEVLARALCSDEPALLAHLTCTYQQLAAKDSFIQFLSSRALTLSNALELTQNKCRALRTLLNEFTEFLRGTAQFLPKEPAKTLRGKLTAFEASEEPQQDFCTGEQGEHALLAALSELQAENAELKSLLSEAKSPPSLKSLFLARQLKTAELKLESSSESEEEFRAPEPATSRSQAKEPGILQEAARTRRFVVELESQKKKCSELAVSLKEYKNKDMLWKDFAVKCNSLLEGLTGSEAVRGQLQLLQSAPTSGAAPKPRLSQDSFVNHLLQNPALLQYHMEQFHEELDVKDSLVNSLKEELSGKDRQIRRLLTDNQQRNTGARRRHLTAGPKQPQGQGKKYQDKQRKQRDLNELSEVLGLVGAQAEDLCARTPADTGVTALRDSINRVVKEFALVLDEQSIERQVSVIKSSPHQASKAIENALFLYRRKLSDLSSAMQRTLETLPVKRELVLGLLEQVECALESPSDWCLLYEKLQCLDQDLEQFSPYKPWKRLLENRYFSLTQDIDQVTDPQVLHSVINELYRDIKGLDLNTRESTTHYQEQLTTTTRENNELRDQIAYLRSLLSALEHKAQHPREKLSPELRGQITALRKALTVQPVQRPQFLLPANIPPPPAPTNLHEVLYSRLRAKNTQIASLLASPDQSAALQQDAPQLLSLYNDLSVQDSELACARAQIGKLTSAQYSSRSTINAQKEELISLSSATKRLHSKIETLKTYLTQAQIAEIEGLEPPLAGGASEVRQDLSTLCELLELQKGPLDSLSAFSQKLREISQVLCVEVPASCAGGIAKALGTSFVKAPPAFKLLSLLRSSVETSVESAEPEKQRNSSVSTPESSEKLLCFDSKLQELASDSDCFSSSLQSRLRALKTEFGTNVSHLEQQKQQLVKELRETHGLFQGPETVETACQVNFTRPALKLLSCFTAKNSGMLFAAFALWRSHRERPGQILAGTPPSEVLANPSAAQSGKAAKIVQGISLALTSSSCLSSHLQGPQMDYLTVFETAEKLMQRKYRDDCSALGKGRVPSAFPAFVSENLGGALGEFVNGLNVLVCQGHQYALFYSQILQVLTVSPLPFHFAVFLTSFKSSFSGLAAKYEKVRERTLEGRELCAFEQSGKGKSALLADVLNLVYSTFSSDKSSGTFILERLCPETVSQRDYVAFLISHKIQESGKSPGDVLMRLNKAKNSLVSPQDLVRLCEGDLDVWLARHLILTVFPKDLKQADFCNWLSISQYLRAKINCNYSVSTCRVLSVLVERYNCQALRDTAKVLFLLEKNHSELNESQFLAFVEQDLGLSIEDSVLSQIFRDTQKSDISVEEACATVISNGLGGYGLACFYLKPLYDLLLPSKTLRNSEDEIPEEPKIALTPLVKELLASNRPPAHFPSRQRKPEEKKRSLGKKLDLSAALRAAKRKRPLK